MRWHQCLLTHTCVHQYFVAITAQTDVQIVEDLGIPDVIKRLA